MKQINCTVIGERTDVPILMIDSRPIRYVADLSEPGRAIFRLTDTEPPWGATIAFGGQTLRLIVPEHPGAYEGPWLMYPSLSPPPVLERLHVDGVTFRTASGQEWIWKGCSDFLLYQRFLDGEDLTGVLDERRDLGANLLRVFGMAHVIERFHPQDYGARYFEALPEFAALLARHGFYVEFVVFADAQIIMPSVSDQQAHFQRVCEALR